MSWNLIDTDGLTETWSHVGNDGATHVVERQNDKPLLEHNKMLRGSESIIDSDFRPLASIPMTLGRKWLKEDGIDEAMFWQWPTAEQNKYWRRKYLSSDYQDLQITPKLKTKLWVSEHHYKSVELAANDNEVLTGGD